MEHIANPTDEALQDAIEAALRTSLGHDAPHIGVATDEGTVTLTGEVPTNDERQTAHAAVLDVWGVHAIANEILVRDARSGGETDTEIAKAAQHALQHADGIVVDSVVAEVTNHIVTLTGTVKSTGERLAAERAVLYLPGLTQIHNRIKVQT